MRVAQMCIESSWVCRGLAQKADKKVVLGVIEKLHGSSLDIYNYI